MRKGKEKFQLLLIYLDLEKVHPKNHVPLNVEPLLITCFAHQF